MSRKEPAIGTVVTRLLSSAQIPMKLKVTKVENGVVHCGPWQFDLATGAEIDEELGWGPAGTGSVIKWSDE